jgi:hypothetical protein
MTDYITLFAVLFGGISVLLFILGGGGKLLDYAEDTWNRRKSRRAHYDATLGIGWRDANRRK